ncbi:hypothetical protein CHH28_13710 [Bacterioplanes sanyensis]|uniref:Response regulatory domain-containing protein n=1 Tax=Bacterioplanes sanyensis TaxID=1249553 RepID=A0A222FLW6_9GAMM|nr:response regulator [Bacterioplanes sanyensis]ASP39662.1 hypothetical protein CHH28_13710 [Bacterioplanes sanyensis]
MNTLLLELELPSTLASVSAFRQQLEAILIHRLPIKRQRNDILLCVSEVGANLVEHNLATSLMRLKFGSNRQQWWLSVEDNGTAFDPDQHTDQQTATCSGEFSLQTHGRGLELIRALSDQLDYQPASSSRWNRLELRWQRHHQNDKPSLLLVDDDASQRRLLTAYLAEQFSIHSAADGREALSIINEHPIDLVLSDIRMPGMNGLDLRQHIANTSRTDTLPFIFLTSSSDQNLLQQATALGIDDYLVKPVQKENLLYTVQRVLERSQQIYRQLTDRINQRISQTLTPRLPKQLHQWQLSLGSRNSGVGGGDLVLFQAGEQHSLITLIDIMGHDEVAKFFSYAYSGYVRGLLSSTSADHLKPCDFLTQLSDGAYQDELLSQITLTSIVLQLGDAGELNIACGGHPAPLLISQSGIEPLPVNGILPGLTDDTRYNSEHFVLSAGQRIACYTDGLFESADSESGRLQLEQQIQQTLIDTLHLPIDEANANVMLAFDRLAGIPPKDDSLLLLLEPIPAATRSDNRQ